MVSKSKTARLDDLIKVDGNIIYKNDTEIARLPTAVAEIARLNTQLFVILSVSDPRADFAYAGSNLWSLDLDGNIMWRAPNLNTDPSDPFFHWKCYSDLRIFDKNNPKIDCFIDERRGAMFVCRTGEYVTDIEPVNWKQDIVKAYMERERLIQWVENEMFIESMRLCDASPRNPAEPRSTYPSSAIIEYGL